ncbi:MAG: iron-sulfur cluster assembly accessory protein [Gammaproteobacteria bacterium]|jgi:iron-sulfur cluster assembly protein|nr:iron-sulfur cluster assembly accessory protein [Gammaproteobacteria bacterium]
MVISLTPAAAAHIRKYAESRGQNPALRLGVRNSGCSGLAYVVELADASGPDDVVYDSEGVRLIVERKNLPYLAGTEIDYRREGLNAGFRFANPNEKASCGCGESFTV